MSLLDLQGLPGPTEFGGHRSSNSGHSCNGSELSVAACEGGSGLSLLLCGH